MPVRNSGGFKAVFVVAAALAVAGCSSGDQQPSTQEKYFDVKGFGKLKPGMSKQEALATGELAATGAGKAGDCEDYRYQGAPAPDPKQVAEDAEIEAQYEAAQKANPRDGTLQYLAGMACMKRQLWGKAQQLLTQAALGLQDVRLHRNAWRALAQLAEQRGDDSTAGHAWKRAASD